jgi:hypothetical protein
MRTYRVRAGGCSDEMVSDVLSICRRLVAVEAEQALLRRQ